MGGAWIPVLTGFVGLLTGALATAWMVRRHRLAREAIARREPLRRDAVSGEAPALVTAAQLPRPEVDANAVSLLGRALRAPLARLRRSEGCRVAWQARMLVARPRPMQAKPVDPMALLQGAAEQVELLRLGKVPASWTLRCRQPVHVDPDRAQAGFRELLTTAAETAGEAGRVGIRVLSNSEPGYPVTVEIEIGRRGSEPDALALLVATRLLESQAAQIASDGHVIRVALRSAPAEPAEPDPTKSIARR
jgi:hypothetical protein